MFRNEVGSNSWFRLLENKSFWLQRLSDPALLRWDYLQEKSTQPLKSYLLRAHFLSKNFNILSFRFKRNLLRSAVAFSVVYNIPRYFEMVTKEDSKTKMLYIESTEMRQNPIYISLYVFWSKLILVRKERWPAINFGAWHQSSGLLEPGGQGDNCPPTFAKISPKFLQNRGFFLKFLFFCPQLWTLPPTCRKVATTL